MNLAVSCRNGRCEAGLYRLGFVNMKSLVGWVVWHQHRSTLMSMVLVLIFGTGVAGQSFTVLHRFAQNGMVDGFGPTGTLILNHGELFGTTGSGGTGTGSGTVFQVDHRTGAETLLYNFMQQPDGQIPYGGVIRDSQGNLYGTT